MTGGGDIGWDHPATAEYYEAFCAAHDRYALANDALIANARLCPGQAVLDFAAGTGRTAEAALAHIGDGRIDCVEPAKAMRRAGAARFADARVRWLSRLPRRAPRYERILCGAAIWQLPFGPTLRRLRPYLRPGGALAFNIPALYLGIADAPGGGDDALLLQLPALLQASGAKPSGPTGEARRRGPAPPDAATVEALLGDAGFSFERWSFRLKLTQAAYRDWLKIPVMTNRLLPRLDAGERARRIDAAFAKVDPASWRWEGWLGWTAWLGSPPRTGPRSGGEPPNGSIT